MSESKYSKEHIQAVEERFCDYLHVIESETFMVEHGGHIIPACVICTTTGDTCGICILRPCKFAGEVRSNALRLRNHPSKEKMLARLEEMQRSVDRNLAAEAESE